MVERVELANLHLARMKTRKALKQARELLSQVGSITPLIDHDQVNMAGLQTEGAIDALTRVENWLDYMIDAASA